MSLEAAVPPARAGYPLLARAVERHLAWARDFALAGDLDSAVDAIRDAHATSAELASWAASDSGP
jgi:hypothetical protein